MDEKFKKQFSQLLRDVALIKSTCSENENEHGGFNTRGNTSEKRK